MQTPDRFQWEVVRRTLCSNPSLSYSVGTEDAWFTHFGPRCRGRGYHPFSSGRFSIVHFFRVGAREANTKNSEVRRTKR